jgi:hypothetical protein
MENNLFTATAFSELKAAGFDVTERSRTTYHADIVIDGKRFDAVDMRDCLSEVKNSRVALTDRKMIDIFKKYGVIVSEGSSAWGSGAEAGPNFHEFRDMLEEKIDALPHADKLE